MLKHAAAVLTLSLLTTVPAAKASDGTPCRAEVDITLAPGLSTSPSSGTWTSSGQTGTIACDGKVNRFDVTGPGTFGGHGHYGSKEPDTCQGGKADGPQFLSIPTSGGAQDVTNEHLATFGPLKGGAVVGGEFTGPRFSGTFKAWPLEGDCVSRPLTKVHLSVTGTLKD